MAESLGEAVLVLRTDDRGLDTGMAKAKAGADGVGASFDKTTASAGRLDQSLAATGRTATATGTQFQKTAATVTTASNAQRAGLQQLSFQIGDVAQGFALGVRPQVIFAQQIGQVTQAIQLMSGGTSKLAAFLSGPWGIALIVAVQLLGPFIGKLFEAKQAAELAEAGANALATAQTSLGEVFDLVSGKLKSQNELLILNARLTAINLRATAIQKRESSQATFASLGTAGNFGIGNGKNFGEEIGVAGRQLIAAVQQGRLSRDEALKRSANIDLTGSVVTREKFQQAIIDSAVADLNDKAANLINQSLDKGVLAPELRNPGKTPKAKKGPKDRTADIADAQAAEIARLSEEEIRARLDLATNIDDRAALQRELLARERTERIRAIQDDKDLNAAQKLARIDYIKRLYGDPKASQLGPDGEIVVTANDSLYAQKLARDVREKELALANDGLAREADALGARASITNSLRARAALESKALELQQQIARNLLEQDIANGRIADADKARALLAEKQSVEKTRQGRSNQGPLARYADGLNAGADNIQQQVEGYVVDELESVRSALRGAISKVTGTDDPLINGLIDILIQQLILKPLANALAGASGGGGGFFGSIFSAIGSLFGGGRAGGGTVSPGKIYAVNERSTTPGFFMPIAAGMIQPADSVASAAPGSGGTGGGGAYFDLRGAVVTEDLLRQMNAISQAHVRQGLAQYDNVVGSRVDDYRERRR